jgi:tetratricopeptide (TPR) repeat protein
MIDTPKHDEWPRELRLDDEAGPAAYLHGAAHEQLVQNVLERAYGAAPAAPRRGASRSMAAAVLLACIGGGSASAAVLWYVRSQHAEPAPVVTQVSKPAPRASAPVLVPPPAAPALEPAREQRAAPVRAAEDWFREGNRLRGAKRWKQADDAYSQAAHAASGNSAYVAYVASAGVRLEHLHDARGALARYRAALQATAHGALDEEIRLGIADAYRALGDAVHEREALETFLREHPSSPLAEQARARLK